MAGPAEKQDVWTYLLLDSGVWIGIEWSVPDANADTQKLTLGNGLINTVFKRQLVIGTITSVIEIKESPCGPGSFKNGEFLNNDSAQLPIALTHADREETGGKFGNQPGSIKWFATGRIRDGRVMDVTGVDYKIWAALDAMRRHSAEPVHAAFVLSRSNFFQFIPEEQQNNAPTTLFAYEVQSGATADSAVSKFTVKVPDEKQELVTKTIRLSAIPPGPCEYYLVLHHVDNIENAVRVITDNAPETPAITKKAGELLEQTAVKVTRDTAAAVAEQTADRLAEGNKEVLKEATGALLDVATTKMDEVKEDLQDVAQRTEAAAEKVEKALEKLAGRPTEPPFVPQRVGAPIGHTGPAANAPETSIPGAVETAKKKAQTHQLFPPMASRRRKVVGVALAGMFIALLVIGFIRFASSFFGQQEKSGGSERTSLPDGSTVGVVIITRVDDAGSRAEGEDKKQERVAPEPFSQKKAVGTSTGRCRSWDSTLCPSDAQLDQACIQTVWIDRVKSTFGTTQSAVSVKCKAGDKTPPVEEEHQKLTKDLILHRYSQKCGCALSNGQLTDDPAFDAFVSTLAASRATKAALADCRKRCKAQATTMRCGQDAAKTRLCREKMMEFFDVSTLDGLADKVKTADLPLSFSGVLFVCGDRIGIVEFGYQTADPESELPKTRGYCRKETKT